MKKRIRPFAQYDFPTLLAIDQSCFDPSVAYDEWELALFMSGPGSRTLVAEADDDIAGFIMVELHPKTRTATLITLDVLKPYRKQHIGSLLLGEAEQILLSEKIRHHSLQVDTQNTAAIGFYEHHGFQTIDTLPNYYGNGADAYVMRKKL